MQLSFSKFQGTGNDFIVIDNRKQNFQLTTSQIKQLCDRKFGIGADGLMLLEYSNSHDFHMIYFNADGRESSMCGNGGRCITAFAKKLEIIENNAHFTAIDGLHEAVIKNENFVKLKMNDVKKIEHFEHHVILDTGSPHYIIFDKNVPALEVNKVGKIIRNQPEFQPTGINVNYVEMLSENQLFVRTFERGVEDETLSCGTGVTAAAIAFTKQLIGDFSIEIKTLGGKLTVNFEKRTPNSAMNIWLVGAAQFVFEGQIFL